MIPMPLSADTGVEPSAPAADRSVLRLRTAMVNGSLTEAALTSSNRAFCAWRHPYNHDRSTPPSRPERRRRHPADAAARDGRPLYAETNAHRTGRAAVHQAGTAADRFGRR